jgi:hypothetical protein
VLGEIVERRNLATAVAHTLTSRCHAEHAVVWRSKENNMNLLCRVGRHMWRTEHDGEQSYDKCTRCGHYRNRARWTDMTADANMPPVDPQGTYQ